MVKYPLRESTVIYILTLSCHHNTISTTNFNEFLIRTERLPKTQPQILLNLLYLKIKHDNNITTLPFCYYVSGPFSSLRKQLINSRIFDPRSGKYERQNSCAHNPIAPTMKSPFRLPWKQDKPWYKNPPKGKNILHALTQINILTH